MEKLILASGSPRRREILESVGADFELLVPEADETVPPLPPEKTVTAIAEKKCRAALALLPPGSCDRIVIAADTVVACGGEIYGKPHTPERAAQMLRALSGSCHSVHTGIAVSRGGQMTVECESSTVFFRELSEREIESYIETGEPLDKAGAYGIQEIGSIFVRRIEGDYFNIVGLPVCRLAEVLRRDFGYDLLEAVRGRR